MPGEGLVDCNVTVSGKRIVEVTQKASKFDDVSVVDCDGFIVAPGLVDIHVHGAMGKSFNSADADDWNAIVDAHLVGGTTTTLPTLACDKPAAMAAALAVAQTIQSVRDIVGVHLEGPYLNPRQRGAHPQDLVRLPGRLALEELEPYFDVLSMVTLAPELEGALDLVTGLTAAGVLVAAGHTEAREAELFESQAHGLSHASHLWSAHSSLEKTPWRRLGLSEVVLSSDDMTAEVIADGSHVNAALLKIAYRCLGKERLCLVSDASAGTGLPLGSRFEMGGCTGVVIDGVALTLEGDAFCGSTSFLAHNVAFAVQEAGLPLVEAIEMASLTPARILGLDHSIGRVKPGYRANLTIFDQSLEVSGVVYDGKWVLPLR